LTDADFFQCGSLEAYKDLFRTGGKSWATLRDLAAAHGHFREIKGTGVLGIFPFGQESNTLKVSSQGQPGCVVKAVESSPLRLACF